MQLRAGTFRFGFLTPAAFDNVVNVGRDKGITIKNCGTDNNVHGGDPVGTDLDTWPEG